MQFQNLIECLEQKLPLIYIDESGFQSESTRPHSYSRKGARAEAEFNWHLKNCSNAIGALVENRLLTVGVFDCSVNTAVFESWIEQDLLPKLKAPSVLIMDNAAFHKGKRLQELVSCSGHYIVWLPKYSPDLNPIEKMWSRVKSIRNKFRIKNIDELFKKYCDKLFGI
ncbi:IS630 family transposase [Acinetobacter chinensis]|uniref:IS630 family transposase n=1 Tax=Acinetobacter chinensis TaxID=2004650 RepID=UPI003741F928